MIHYIEINILLASGFILWALFYFLLFHKLHLITASRLLKLTQVFLLVPVILPFFIRLLPQHTSVAPMARIWSEPTFSLKDLGLIKPSVPALYFTETTSLKSIVDFQVFQKIFWLLFLIGALISIFRILLGWLRILKIIRSSQLIRRIGRVQILMCDGISVPFSFFIPRKAYVVLPYGDLENVDLCQAAVFHEIQHHRQGDTQWIHLFQILKTFLFWNPALLFWEREISILRELACDEALIRRRKLSPRQYVTCLFTMAEQSLAPSPAPVCSIGMALGVSGKALKRRISLILSTPTRKYDGTMAWLAGVIIIAVLGSIALACLGNIPDQIITMNQAQEMAETAALNSQIPITINKSVLRELNRFIGTPEARAYMRGTISRMQMYRPMIERTFKQYGIPKELIAMPIVESGFKNMKRHNGDNVGIWQWSIEADPRFVTINDHRDDRLDPEKATIAICRYMSKYHGIFNDWFLTVLMTNRGEDIYKGIRATGSWDAWKIVEAGFENDHDYLPMLMAAVLIIKNPVLLN